MRSLDFEGDVYRLVTGVCSWPSDATDQLKEDFGIPKYLPPEGVETFEADKILFRVLPQQPKAPGQYKRFDHRFQVRCPRCLTWMGVSRLKQHHDTKTCKNKNS